MDCPSDNESNAGLSDAFGRLDPAEQRILGLIYFGRQTQEQVAGRLVVSLESVARVTSRAMIRLGRDIEGIDVPA